MQAITVTPSVTNLKCYGGVDGSITLDVAGEWKQLILILTHY